LQQGQPGYIAWLSNPIYASSGTAKLEPQLTEVGAMQADAVVDLALEDSTSDPPGLVAVVGSWAPGTANRVFERGEIQ
jgi:hypothetical protein